MIEAKDILVIEDDARLAELLVNLLRNDGYTVDSESRGDQAVSRILDESPALVILDINLPGKNGFAVCREVRPRYSGRIIMLTARGEEVDEVIGLEAGADDYLAKPVAPRRLLARVRANIRKRDGTDPTPKADAPIRTGNLEIHPGQREVFISGKPVEMSSAEFELLLFLGQNIGKVVKRETVFKKLRGIDYDGQDRSFDLRISRLRRHLGDDPRKPALIKTIHGVGYLLARDL